MELENKPKASGKRALLMILAAVPFLIILEMTVGTVISVKGVNQIAKSILLDKITDAGQIASSILYYHRMETIKDLEAINLPKENAKLFGLGLKHPEIVEVNQVAGGKGYASYFTAAPTAKVHDGIMKNAAAVIDSAKISFNNAFWDSSLKIHETVIEVDSIPYLFTFLKTGETVKLIVFDAAKLVPNLKTIFDEGVEKRQLGRNYFRRFGSYTAKIKIFDRSGQEIFTYGDAQGHAWKETWDMELKTLPWKMQTQLYCENPLWINSASVAGKTPWLPIIKGLIAIASVVWLYWLCYKDKR